MDTDREMDIRIVEILAAHDELERQLVLGQLGKRAKRMMQNGEIGGGNNASQAGPNAADQAAAGAGGNAAGCVYAGGSPGY